MLQVLTEESHSGSVHGSSTCICIPDSSPTLQIADICLEGISIFISLKALKLNMSHMNSTPLLVLQTCSQSHWCNSGYDKNITFVAQLRSLESLPLLYSISSLPPVYLPHHCKNNHFTFPCPHLFLLLHPLLSSKLSNCSVPPTPTAQDEVQRSYHALNLVSFQTPSILVSISFKTLYIPRASCSWPLLLFS